MRCATSEHRPSTAAGAVGVAHGKPSPIERVNGEKEMNKERVEGGGCC